MNERIRELFEEITAPSFGHELQYPRNEKGEYINPVLEDHWQTFQEGFELAVKECAKFLDENSGYDQCNNAWHPEPEDLLEYFGVK